MMMHDIELIDGPMVGQVVSIEGTGGLNIEGPEDLVPAGHVAYYRPTRDRSKYRFKGFAKVMVRIPWPPGDSGGSS